jgi:hypothetical protein
MIDFQDFIPQLQRKRMLGIVNDYESIREVVTRANRWIEREGVRVINVETLILPLVPDQKDQETPTKMDGFSSAIYTYQVVRVWYVEDSTVNREYTGETRRLVGDEAEAEAVPAA